MLLRKCVINFSWDWGEHSSVNEALNRSGSDQDANGKHRKRIAGILCQFSVEFS